MRQSKQSTLSMQNTAQVKLTSDTLEESICATVWRDVKNIGVKLKYIIIPRWSIEPDSEAAKQLRKWDLWGPLVLCLLFSFVLNLGIEGDDNGKSFGIIFVIMWGGSLVVTINTKLLGGHISFCQSVCVLGYCIFPIVLAALGIYFLKIFNVHLLVVKILIAGFALVWATACSISFMNVIVQPEKKLVALYPIFLFYLFIAWFLLFI